MNTKKPIQAKSTQRILKAVFPENFKIVNDIKSNGFKYINLLYGVEFDEAHRRSQQVYNDSFIDTFDVSKDYELYQVDVSGTPNTQYLNGDSSINIKVTNDDEFYNGSPTRVRYLKRYQFPIYSGAYVGSYHQDNSFVSGFYTQCWSNVSGIIGLEYFRANQRGSGYFVIFSDDDQVTSYQNNMWSAHRLDVNTNFQTFSDFDRRYGFLTGIQDQSFEKNGKYEVLDPITERTLSGLYPLHREVTDNSGIIWSIDHYTPYHGWTRNETGDVVAVVDYSGTYYYDDNGTKVFYRTAKNNPYGYGNYNIAYLDLEHTPISGTLKLYDIDILDLSGNATEIPASGKPIYYYKSDRMFVGSSGTYSGTMFDPIYLGYETSVPSGNGFSEYSQGKPTTLFKTISWEYINDGAQIDPGTLQFVNGSGDITNKISITNPQTRYMVEYKYKSHNKSKYISSLESNGFVSNESISPIYTVDVTSGNLQQVPFEFTRNPHLIEANQQSKIITFDGLTTRPYKYLYKIDFDIPLMLKSSLLDSFFSLNANEQYIGYSDDFVPQESTNLRNYLVNCNFDQPVVSGTATELDLTGNSNQFIYNGSGTLYQINYGSYYGKKIITGQDSFYYINNLSILKDYTFFHLGFKLKSEQNATLIQIQDTTLDKYLTLTVEKSGRIIIKSGDYTFYSSDNITFDNIHKEFILRYVADDLSSSVPTFKLYYKSELSVGFSEIRLILSTTTADTVSSTYLQIFKNCSVDIDFFKVYYEVQ
jgi:hypothetical protein